MKTYKRKVFIINGNNQYRRMFEEMGWEVTDRMENADLVQFTGGEDVNPSMYGETAHPTTSYSFKRDMEEESQYQLARSLNKPMAGICRGGQFLNVMCGGKLFQHVDCHGLHGTHELVDMYTGRVVNVTSTHHQMMRRGSAGQLIAYAGESNFRLHMVDGKEANIPRTPGDQDTEVVFYPTHQVLCFQPHPEYGYKDCRDYYFELITRLFHM